jgi:hypothetical protein
LSTSNQFFIFCLSHPLPARVGRSLPRPEALRLGDENRISSSPILSEAVLRSADLVYYGRHKSLSARIENKFLDRSFAVFAVPRYWKLEAGIAPHRGIAGFPIDDYTCFTYAGPMTFSEQLKAIRRRERISQATAARLIHRLSTRTLQAWERGQQSPPPWAQLLVLEALGGPPYDAAKKRRGRPARNGRHGKNVK